MQGDLNMILQKIHEWDEIGDWMERCIPHVCNGCKDGYGNILMHGYAEKKAHILLCVDCAKQLCRKLMEDICDIDSKGGRCG
jgi:hypothetical protein